MRTLTILSATAALTAAVPALAQPAEELNVYPALGNGGAAYAIRVNSEGRIVKCQPLDPATAPAKAEAGCAALTAKGVPSSITPARPKTLPRTWIGGEDLSPDDRRRGGKVEMIFEVDEDGKVTGCNAWRSSGSTTFDTTACTAVMVRARFAPATFKGQPTRAVGTMPYSYRP